MEQSYWSSCAYGELANPLTIYNHSKPRPLSPPPSVLATKVLLGITVLGISCQYRTLAPSNSSSDLIGLSPSHMTVPSRQSSISELGPGGERSTDMNRKGCSKCRPPQPLADVERFTLCSNRIIWPIKLQPRETHNYVTISLPIIISVFMIVHAKINSNFQQQ